jgi:tryptophan synthase alpha subunit
MRSMIRLSVLLIAIAILVFGGFTGVRNLRADSACDIPKVRTIPPGYVFVGYGVCDNQDLEIWREVSSNGLISRPSN